MELKDRYRELRLPVRILAGAADRVIGVEGHSVRLHNLVEEVSNDD